MSIIKVFANSRVSAVAAAIASIIHNHQPAELQAIEEEAVTQALKAVDLAIVYFKRREIDIHCVMESADETIDEDTPRAIRLIVKPQSSLDQSSEMTQRFPILN